MATIVKPPDKCYYDKPSLFLAGTIDMGRAENWQFDIEQEFILHDIIILNPRRDNWNLQWQQNIKNDLFRQQVEWELEALENCDLILMYFVADSQSPVTLLELGLHAKSEKIIVCCPHGYWRKGNVDIVCQRYNIPIYDDINKALTEIKNKIN